MARRCPGCGVSLAPRAWACPRCRPLVPAAVLLDLARCFVSGQCGGPTWDRARTAGVRFLVCHRRERHPRPWRLRAGVRA